MNYLHKTLKFIKKNIGPTFELLLWVKFGQAVFCTCLGLFGDPGQTLFHRCQESRPLHARFRRVSNLAD